MASKTCVKRVLKLGSEKMKLCTKRRQNDETSQRSGLPFSRILPFCSFAVPQIAKGKMTKLRLKKNTHSLKRLETEGGPFAP